MDITWILISAQKQLITLKEKYTPTHPNSLEILQLLVFLFDAGKECYVFIHTQRAKTIPDSEIAHRDPIH